MCRSITTLYHCDPPTTDDEIRAAALQFVRKISGYRAPSKGNEAAFNEAVEAITTASTALLLALETNAPLRQRVVRTRQPPHGAHGQQLTASTHD
ncbi:MAG TPA: DUF2277 domain-containing protein [Ktedonobacterales bacterium]|nr:DUF2277 domain-containing protein [Ktedonobacterales bacterium]